MVRRAGAGGVGVDAGAKSLEPGRMRPTLEIEIGDPGNRLYCWKGGLCPDEVARHDQRDAAREPACTVRPVSHQEDGPICIGSFDPRGRRTSNAEAINNNSC